MLLQEVAAAVMKLSSRRDVLEAGNNNQQLFAMLKSIELEVTNISTMHNTWFGHHMGPTQSSPTGE